MRNKEYPTVRRATKSNREIVEKEVKSIPLYTRLLTFLAWCRHFNKGGVKLNL